MGTLEYAIVTWKYFMLTALVSLLGVECCSSEA